MKDANIALSHLIRIVREAGNQIMEIYENSSIYSHFELKSDYSPLTVADRTSNHYICSQLHELYPEIPVISEENRETDFSIRKNYKLFWLLDPLDGTKEFLKRNGEFTVNLALIDSGKPVLGIVHVPFTHKTYYARKGHGAYLEQGICEPEKLTVSAYHPKAEGLRIVASRSHMNTETEEYLKRFLNPKLLSMGSSLKFMLVAEGLADLYPRLGPTSEWDTAASQIIVEEAGGQVLDLTSLKELRYNKENLLNPYFIAKGKEIA